MSEQNAVAAPVQERPFSALELLAVSQGTSVRALAQTMPASLVMMLDDAAYERCWSLAKIMSQSAGMVPEHLLGKVEACFQVMLTAITWKLDPGAVARCTYMPAKNAKIGFEGKLVQSILERSGHFEGQIRYQHTGDWEKIEAKGFKLAENQFGKKYAVPNWTLDDAKAIGCGVIVIGQVKGEAEPRTWPMKLHQCFPMNSTLWATDPKTQICYTAVRRFANLAAPSLLMGAPFHDGTMDDLGEVVDVTPAPARPQPGDHQATRRRSSAPKGGPVTDAVIQEDKPAASAEPKEGPAPAGATTRRPEPETAADASGQGGTDASGGEPESVDEDGVVTGDGSGEALPPVGEDGDNAQASLDAETMQAFQDLCNGYRAEIAEASSLEGLAIVEKDWKEWRGSERGRLAPDGMLSVVSTALIERKVQLAPRRGGKR